MIKRPSKYNVSLRIKSHPTAPRRFFGSQSHGNGEEILKSYFKAALSRWDSRDAENILIESEI